MHNTNMEMSDESVQTISNPDDTSGPRNKVWFIVLHLHKLIVCTYVGFMIYMFYSIHGLG